MNDDIQLTNLLCFSVYNMNRLFNRFYQQALAPFGLTYAQYLVLMSLWERDNQTLHELGDELKLNSNTLTPLLKRLENNGWLTRVHPENDRRQLIVSLSDKGLSEKDAIFQALADCIAKYKLSPKQYEQALALNNDLIQAFEDGLAVND